MKQKLTTLLFGLLLAVGWTSSAFAQEATYKASDIQTWTYDWVDENGVTQTSYYIDQETGQADQVTNPYQMYGMLRSIYMDKRFPGPTYAGYANNGTTRERKVYYGDIAGGWSISNTELSDIRITTSATNVNIASVTLYDENDQPIEGQTWTCPTNYTTTASNLGMPSGWSLSTTPTHNNTAYISFNGGGSIIIPASAFAGKTAVRVDVRCRRTAGQQYTTTNRIAVGPSGDQETQWFTNTSWYDKTWNVVGQTSTTQYKPEAEGYTAIVVAVKDTTNLPAELPSPLDPNNATATNLLLNSKADIIDYFTKNVVYMKLLTDGLRIGSDSDYSRGTVFSCDGRYNKFFFLSKGQARQKDTNYVINYQATNGLLGELGPFKEMFEEFSPTSGEQNSQITDFYSKMMEGSVYNVVHDCASVIQMGHQFSMSGNAGVEHFPLSGLNFFIPDYRLKYWADGSNDGRDMNPTSTSGWRTHYAQYNQDYAPKIGIYKITLKAEAEMIAASDTTHQPGNRNYKVTLNWVSSLNEMSGHEVPQIYTVYYYDENGQRQKLVVEGQTNTDAETGNTTLTYYVEQRQHSYTIDYIVMGTPDDNDHPAFIAWSNVDGVTIPGWDDFLALSKDHHESDFIVSDMANWYRNFMLVDNDIFNGLTVTNVSEGMNTFNIYRYNNKDASEKKVAILSFDNPTAERVHYTVTYDDAGTNSELEDQMILEKPKYQRSTMGIPDQGYVRVVGNGDIVIQPSSYDVNFKSITVKNNGSTIGNNTWNSNQSNLPSNWGVSPGSVWEPYTVTGTGDKVYYLEGGGYIYIPNILNNSNYTNVTVEIVAYGDGAAHANIAVNDHKQAIANNTAATYTWNVSGTRGGDRATTYEKVTSANQLVTGKKYIFVYENGSNSYAMGSYSNGSDASAVAVALNGNTVDVNDNIMQFTLGSADGYYTFTKPNNGGLLGLTYTSSWGNYTYYFTTGGSYYRWNVTGNSNGYITNNANATNLYIKYFSSESSFILGSNANNPNAVLYVEKESTPEPPTPVEGGLLRLGHLHIVDQLKEAIPTDNNHPDNYTYVLRYEPNGPNGEGVKTSGTVNFPIEKTAAKVDGYYTQVEVDADTFEPLLPTDPIKADVVMDLTESDPNVLYQQIQGKKNGIPALGEDYLTQLGKMGTSDRYMEMLETSPNFEQVYEADIHHYFEHETEVTKGTYAVDYFTYAPSVSTWGLDRRYYESDGLDNTYGAPYFKTGVGQVSDPTNLTAQKQMKQVNGEWVPNPSTTWTEGDVEGAQSYTLYFLSASAQGYLPSSTVSNLEYEPYMFRVFVESASGKLRKFEPVIDEESGIQIALKDGGPITGKYCVGSFYANSNTWTWDSVSSVINFTKTISNDAPTATDAGWNGNMKFGYPIDGTDLKVYVRFYFMRKGWKPQGREDGPARPASASESRGGTPTPGTGIYEIFGAGNGEVVSTTYFNAQGIQSDKPFDGVNIVVTRYSDGSTRTTKVIR